MKIPDDRKPSYEVTINGVKNSFAPGTEVGGDVASALFGTETFPPAPPETDKPFNIPASGSTVSANPTLAGTEDSLTGIEIDGTKYKVGGGSSGGGAFIVHATMSDNIMTLDKTWQEIYDAGGSVINTKMSATTMTNLYIYNTNKYSNTYLIFACAMQNSGDSMQFRPFEFIADSADGYPSATMS